MGVIFAYSCALFFLNLSTVLAQSVAPSEDYHQVRIGSFRYVYSQEWSPHLSQVVAFNQALNQHYEESYGFKLDELSTIVLASASNQETNGFATQYPFSITVFYQGGSDAYDDFANLSWWKTLLIHEVAHLYQLNAKQELSKFADRVFGNEVITFLPLPFAPFPFIPVLNTPNMFLPTWLIEGNAVMNESRFGLGGRLYSGQTINLVNSLLLQKEVDEKRLTNNVLDFPFTREKYLLGGILNARLVEKHGVEKVNHYFLQQSFHYFNPFRLNFTFESYFGESYTDFVSSNLQELKRRAVGNQSAGAKLLQEFGVNHLAHYGLHREKDKILISTRKDFYSPVTMATINAQEAVNSKQTLHLGGKAFLYSGEILTSAVGKTTKQQKLFSLWNEREVRLKEFDGIQVFDINGSNILGASVTGSLDGLELVLNGKSYAKAHSSALLDSDGRPVYFVQEGENRWLMRGKEKLFSFKGYYAYPVDVVADEIYYVSNTSHGSGLFLFKGGKNYRLTKSDRIINARKLNSQTLLLVEQDAHGYQYGILALSQGHVVASTPEAPKWILGPINKTLATASEENLPKSSSYGDVSDLRFSSWSLSTAFFMDKTVLGQEKRVYDYSTSVSFYDPILYYGLVLSGKNQESTGEREAGLTFFLNRYLWQWQFFYQYESFKNNEFTARLGTSATHEAGLYGEYLLSRYKQWEYWMGLGYSHVLSQNGTRNWPKPYAGLEMKRALGTSLSMFPFIRDHHQLEALSERQGTAVAWHTQWGRRLWGKYFADLGADVHFTDRGLIAFHEHLSEENVFLPIRTLNVFPEIGKWSFGTRLGGRIKGIYDVHAYSRWFPIGIHQWAPGVVVNGVDYESKIKASRQQAFEYGVSADFNLLVGHIATVQGQLYTGKRKHLMQDEHFIQFSMGKGF